MVRWVLRYLAPLVQALFRPKLQGLEHLPAQGPFVLVANHSAGMGVAEILSFLVLYLKTVGPARPLAGLVLPLDFFVFPLSVFVRALGCLPATYAAAGAALRAGVPLLVFPGGDHEALRPVWQASRVDFGGRLGFLRLACAAQVPVVPLGIRGGAFTAPILWRSHLLAWLLVVPRFLGLKRWGLSLLGVLGALAIAWAGPLSWPWRCVLVWLWLGSPLVFLPWVPWTVRFRVGPALSPANLFPSAESPCPEHALERALVHVEGALQDLVRRP